MTVKIIDELNRKHTYFEVLSVMEMKYYILISFLNDKHSEMIDKSSVKTIVWKFNTFNNLK